MTRLLYPEMKLRVCTCCGLNDRNKVLKDRHRPAASYEGPLKGGYCPGPVRSIPYVPNLMLSERVRRI